MKARYLLPAIVGLMCQTGTAQETMIQYLSGTDKDHTVAWQFFCSDGMKSGQWTTIAVPSCWELQGFGGYSYGWDRDPHREQGHYRHTFQAPETWRGRRVFLTFEGVMTDATVSLNGQSAGPTHQGAFYRFQYEVTDLLKLGGENELDVLVDKESANASVNEAERRADYWIFGGIFRPVYLEIKPRDFIERVAIDARHDGSFRMLAFPNLSRKTERDVSVEAEIQTPDGRRVGKPVAARGIGSDGAVTLAGKLTDPLQWTSETPNLYQAVFRLKSGGRTLHEYRQRFGFRTIEVRQGDGFYVNGVKVLLKGVNRHTIWPETGRAISPAVALEDVRLIKEMNMNAVRMSHYPPDSYFLDYCDSLGLYVLDELAGWQSKYDTPTARRLVGEMVRRDVNHPCILFWDNGNEGGFNTEVRGDYAVWDPQHRQVLEPWGKLDGVDTRHYPGYAHSLEAVSEGDHIYMPTESLHGLHDGGHGAGIEDYWETLRQWKLYAGQFLWNLTDEGIIRHDRRDTLDAKGNLGTDGILGPHHEKEGSFYTIKQVWSPVFVRRPKLDASWDGSLYIENRYHFTDLSQCAFTMGLTRYGNRLDASVLRADSTSLPTVSLKPGEDGILHLPLPDEWRDYDMLRLTARDARGQEICTWQWPVTTPAKTARRLLAENGSAKMDNETRARTEAAMAKLAPKIIGQPMPKQTRMDWTLLPDGTVRLNYEYLLDGDYDYAGVAFTYPEQGVTGATLMANGPYRVWKNRLKGPGFGIYEKPYNNSITGEKWDYPEFKGYYAEFHAVTLHNSQQPDLTLFVPNEDRFVQLYAPQRPAQYVAPSVPVVPQEDICVLSHISPIGSKFTLPHVEGPQGEKNHCKGQTIRGSVYLRFGE